MDHQGREFPGLYWCCCVRPFCCFHHRPPRPYCLHPAVCRLLPLLSPLSNNYVFSVRWFPKQPVRKCVPVNYCPESYCDTLRQRGKWQLIQCFVLLTDNLEPISGGFDCAGLSSQVVPFLGWTWKSFCSRSPYDATSKQRPYSRPCMGEYTHLDLTLDCDIMERVTHILVRTGSMIFWEFRDPFGRTTNQTSSCILQLIQCHWTSKDPPCKLIQEWPPTHAGEGSGGCGDGGAHPADVLKKSQVRAVMYCLFLLNVAVSRRFASMQLEDWVMRWSLRVGDCCNRRDDDYEGKCSSNAVSKGILLNRMHTWTLTDLRKQLLGLSKWSWLQLFFSLSS